MKAMRRFLSLALTLAMVLSFFSGASVASAEDGDFSLSAVIEDGQVRLDIIANEELKALAGVQFDIHRPDGVDMPSEDDDEAYVPYKSFGILVSPEGVYSDTSKAAGVTIPAGAVFLTIYFPDVCDNNYSIEVVDMQDADFTGAFEDLIGQTASVSLDTHEYGEPSYEWAEDNSSVTASRVCAKNPEHVDSETVTPAVSTTKEATCEEAGEATYTATFTNPAFAAQTKTAEVPALGHAYGDPTYEWAEDNSSVTARSVCANDASHVIEETAQTTSEITKEATCEEAGEATYTATFKNEAFETQTKTAPIDPIGHKYGTPTYEWADDNSSVTARAVCENDPAHVVEETVKTTSEITKPATCEDKGETTYTATFTNALFEAQTKTVADLDPIGHKYGAPEYAWADDNSEVTAKMVCENDPTHVVEETVKTTVATSKEATCEEAGEATYTATFENEAFETQTRTAPVPALGHAYGEPEYTWADDNSSVTAKTVCANDPTHVIEETAATTSEVTKQPTCEEPGQKTFTATFKDEHFTAQTKTVDDLAPLGHAYGEPEYTWADDNSEVTAKMVCANDPSHVVEETVKTEVSYSKQPTCEEAGEATYTATFENEAFKTQTKTAAVPALGHAYGEPEYTWADDNSEVTAKTVCANDPTHVIEQTVKTEAKVTKEATCEDKGETTYTATFTDEHFTAQTKTVANIDALGHAYGEPEYTWADDNSEVTAKTVCANDPTHVIEQTVKTTSEITKPATCEDKGETTYTATFTDEHFTAQTKTVADIDALGHAYGEPEYTWADDNSEVTAKTVCANDPTHVIEETVKTEAKVTKEATCEDKGETTYTATFADEHFTAQTKTVANIDALGHDYEEPKYEWTDDFSSVKATTVCKRDASHTVEETVSTSYAVVTEPTLSEDGLGRYTATFTKEPFTVQTKDEVIPKLGQLITVTNYANGSKCIDAEGRELGGENLYYGEVTFTVESNENDYAIAVFLKEGDALTRLTCTTADGVHSFTVNVTEPIEIVLGYKGDADLDGTVKTTDGTMIKRIALKSYTIEDPNADLKALLCDLNGDGAIKPTEGTMTSRAAMNNFQIDW